MKKQVIENFNEWIFEAEAPNKPAAPVIPAGYKKTTRPKESVQLLTDEEVLKAKGWKALANTDTLLVKRNQFGNKVSIAGFASDKVEDFNKTGSGVLVMGPSI
jgi:hypothetical protein